MSADSMNWLLGDMVQVLPGARLQGDPAVAITRICTDSRDVRAGDLFVALQGERFDAASFVPQAIAAGAKAFLLNADRAAQVVGTEEMAAATGVLVPDTKLALGQLAAAWRQRIHGPLIAVAGSNGKTTVTQMLASVLSVWTQENFLATQGNFNNDIGLPLTLLRWRPGMRAAVVELGMNHVGEMPYLSRLAAPTVALVNNAQREHQEFMQSVEAVARENGAVLSALRPGGVGVVPHGDVHVPIWREMAGAHTLMTFGESPEADVHLQACRWVRDAWQVQAATPAGALQFALHVVGRHNVRNALAAATCALAAGATLPDIAEGLSAFRAVPGRSRVILLGEVTLIDDTYNANPDSVEALIDVLAELPAPRLLVLGDMGEVGDQGQQFHRDAGAYAVQRGVDRLLTLGELAQHASQAFGASATHSSDFDALLQHLQTGASRFSTVAVKGSRFMRMERAVHALQIAHQPNGGDAC